MKNYSSLPQLLADLAAEGLTDVSLNGINGLSLEGEFRVYEVRWGSCELAVLDRAEGWMHLGYAAHPSGLSTPPTGPYFGHLPQAFSLAEAQALRAQYSLCHPYVIVLGTTNASSTGWSPRPRLPASPPPGTTSVLTEPCCPPLALRGRFLLSRN